MARRGGGRPVTQREEAQPSASRNTDIDVAASVRIVDPLQVWSITGARQASNRRNASGRMLRRVKCRFKGSEGKERRAQSEQPGAIAMRSVLGAASAAVALASLFRPRPRPQEQSRAWTPSTPVRVSGLDWSGASHNVTTRLIHEHTKPRPAKVEARSIVWCRSSQNNSPPRFEVFGLACGRICIDAL